MTYQTQPHIRIFLGPPVVLEVVDIQMTQDAVELLRHLHEVLARATFTRPGSES